MNRAIEIGAMILGSVSLVLVSFLGFAVMSGVPLHEVAGIGGLFEAPEAPDPEGPRAPDDPLQDPLAGLPQREFPQRAPERLVQSSLGLMSAYSLPSPYTQMELQELIDELKGRAARLEARSLDLDEREVSLAESEEGFQQRLSALLDLQDRLDSFQRELLAREREIARDEDAVRMADERKYAEVARVLEGFEGERRTQLLTQYAPDEAALILLALPDDVRAEALAGLGDAVTPEEVKAYVEAYSTAADDRKR